MGTSKMDMAKFFALCNMFLSLAACLSYLIDGNWRLAIYWGAAAVITGSVTIGVTK